MKTILPGLLLLLSSSANSAEIVFNNMDRPARVQIEGPVFFPMAGGIEASCVVQNGTCVALQEPPPPPVVALSFVTAEMPFADGSYPRNTTFTFLNTISGVAAVCVKVSSGFVGASPWSNAVAAPVAQAVFSISQAGTYTFRLDCYNDGGRGQSSTLSLRII